MDSPGVVIYGASKPHKGGGGHGKVVADILECSGATIIGFLDDNKDLQGTKFFGYFVLGGREKLSKLLEAGCRHTIIAIGNNVMRRKLAKMLKTTGFGFSTAIHPRAVIARSAKIGAGTVIAATAVVNPDVIVGKQCIINTGAVVEHDNIIGSFVHIAPGARLGGRVIVGDGTDVFTNATILPDICVGKNCVVGAGAIVLKDVPDGATIVGNPARMVKIR